MLTSFLVVQRTIIPRKQEGAGASQHESKTTMSRAAKGAFVRERELLQPPQGPAGPVEGV